MKRIPWSNILSAIAALVFVCLHAAYAQVAWVFSDEYPLRSFQGQIAGITVISVTLLSLGIFVAVVIGWWNDTIRNKMLSVILPSMVTIWLVGFVVWHWIAYSPKKPTPLDVDWLNQLLAAWMRMWT